MLLVLGSVVQHDAAFQQLAVLLEFWQWPLESAADMFAQFDLAQYFVHRVCNPFVVGCGAHYTSSASEQQCRMCVCSSESIHSLCKCSACYSMALHTWVSFGCRLRASFNTFKACGNCCRPSSAKAFRNSALVNLPDSNSNVKTHTL